MSCWTSSLVAVVEVCLFITRGRHSCVAVFWRSSNGRQNVWLEEKHLNESLPNFGCNCRLKLGRGKCVHNLSLMLYHHRYLSIYKKKTHLATKLVRTFILKLYTCHKLAWTITSYILFIHTCPLYSVLVVSLHRICQPNTKHIVYLINFTVYILLI